MANRKVAFLRCCCTESVWRRLRVNPVHKGQGWSEQLSVPTGQSILEHGEYQLRWYEGTRACFKVSGRICKKPSHPGTINCRTPELSWPSLLADEHLFPNRPHVSPSRRPGESEGEQRADRRQDQLADCDRDQAWQHGRNGGSGCADSVGVRI